MSLMLNILYYWKNKGLKIYHNPIKNSKTYNQFRIGGSSSPNPEQNRLNNILWNYQK